MSTAVTGLSPEIMGLGPVEAIPAALKNAGLTLDDTDLFEINEAFAVQALGSAQKLGIPIDKLNVVGTTSSSESSPCASAPAWAWPWCLSD